MSEQNLFPLLAQSHKLAGEPPLTQLLDFALHQHLGSQYGEVEQLLAGRLAWVIQDAAEPLTDLLVRCFVKRPPAGHIRLAYSLPLAGLAGLHLLPLLPRPWRSGGRVILNFCSPDEPVPFINHVPLPPGHRVTEAMTGWFKAVSNEVGYACRCDALLHEAVMKLRDKLGVDRHGRPKGHATIEGVLAAISPAYQRATGREPVARKVVPAYLSQLTADRIGLFAERCATVATLQVEREPRIVYE